MLRSRDCLPAAALAAFLFQLRVADSSVWRVEESLQARDSRPVSCELGRFPARLNWPDAAGFAEAARKQPAQVEDELRQIFLCRSPEEFTEFLVSAAFQCTDGGSTTNQVMAHQCGLVMNRWYWPLSQMISVEFSSRGGNVELIRLRSRRMVK